MSALAELKTQSRALSAGILNPTTLAEALEMAKCIANSTIIPKDYQGNPGNILVAIQWGLEIGLQPLQAMQNIAVINGRPSLWGDSVLALCKSSPACEYITETLEGDGDDLTAICVAKRRGDPMPVERTFTMADAKKASLLGKPGPWTQYPKRMLQMRARGYCLRDAFPDVLRGMAVAEEEQDKPREVTGRAETSGPTKSSRLEKVAAQVRTVAAAVAPVEEPPPPPPPGVDPATGEVLDSCALEAFEVGIQSCHTVEEVKDMIAKVPEEWAEEDKKKVGDWMRARIQELKSGNK